MLTKFKVIYKWSKALAVAVIRLIAVLSISNKQKIIALYSVLSRYQDLYKDTQKGEVGITLNSDWFAPRNEFREADIDATERAIQFFLGWFAHPIFKGDYPQVMKVRAIFFFYIPFIISFVQ